MKKIIINADDLFFNDEIDRGIGELIDMGIITSVSVLVNFNYSSERFKAFYKDHPNASYGLHVNLTEGFPLSNMGKIKSVVDDRGRFYKTVEFTFRVHTMRAKEIRYEIEKQIERYMESGVPLTHLDSHGHVFWSSRRMRRLQADIVSEYNIPIRSPNINDANNHTILFKALRLYLGIFENNLAKGISMPDALIDLFGRRLDRESVVENLNIIKDGISELLTHPGHVSCGRFYDRERQFSILESGWFKESLKQYSLVPCNFNELTRYK